MRLIEIPKAFDFGPNETRTPVDLFVDPDDVCEIRTWRDYTLIHVRRSKEHVATHHTELPAKDVVALLGSNPLTAQRDALLAALERLLWYAEDCASDREEYPSCLGQARAAIAAAKGE